MHPDMQAGLAAEHRRDLLRYAESRRAARAGRPPMAWRFQSPLVRRPRVPRPQPMPSPLYR